MQMGLKRRHVEVVHATFCGNYQGNEKVDQWEMAEQNDGQSRGRAE